MNIVKHNPWGTGLVTANHYQQGLGFRLFGMNIRPGKWLRKAVQTAKNMVQGFILQSLAMFGGEKISDEVGGWFDSVIDAIDTSKFLNGTFTTDKLPGSNEISDAEALLLDQWLNSKFSVWLKAIIEEVGAALKLQNPQTMLIALNAIENKINIVQDHYAVADKQGLSALAVEQRSYLIYTALLPVHEAIKSGIAAKGLQVTTMPVQFQASAYNLMPLFASTILTTVQGENYKLAAGSGTIPVKTLPAPGKIKPGSNPTAPTGTGKGGNQVIPISSGGSDADGAKVVDNKGNVQEQQPAPAKKFNYWPWLAAAALAGGVIAVSKGRKKGGRPAKSKK